MKKIYTTLSVSLIAFSFATPTFAATADVSQISNFIQNVIQTLAGLSGLVAAGFFVVGGFGYITSSGNPEHLDKSKRTILYSAIGLAICLSAFVLTNIVTQLAQGSFGK